MEYKTPSPTEQMRSYSEVRDFIDKKQYDKALDKLKNAELNESTRNQLEQALETGDNYIIERTFAELDNRIYQALCWNCWRE